MARFTEVNSVNNSSNSSLTASRGSQEKHLDEEDGSSVTSSFTIGLAPTSLRTTEPKVTIGLAPRFQSTKRLERRKEFYQKLEEKHQALEVERKEYEERVKEDEEAAIKQLRKSMVYKASPVPSFYYEAPPPKTTLKKLPLTRPKSPNLHQRNCCNEIKNSCTVHHHSKDNKQTNIHRFNGPVNSLVNSPRAPKIKEHSRSTRKNASRPVKPTYNEPKLDDERQSETGKNAKIIIAV